MKLFSASRLAMISCALFAGESVSAQSAQPFNKKQMAARQSTSARELRGPWKAWLQQDVLYIVTDEERAAFKRLKNDDKRQEFTEQFWQRRDPTPDTPENEFKEEHYRRIAYANYHFSSGLFLPP